MIVRGKLYLINLLLMLPENFLPMLCAFDMNKDHKKEKKKLNTSCNAIMFFFCFTYLCLDLYLYRLCVFSLTRIFKLAFVEIKVAS